MSMRGRSIGRGGRRGGRVARRHFGRRSGLWRQLAVSAAVVALGGQLLSAVAGPADAATGPLAYVVNEFAASSSTFGGFVVPVNLATGVEQAPISLGVNPYDIALSPDGGTAWVTIRGENKVTPIPLSTGTAGT